MNIKLVKYPTDEDWMLCKQAALTTMRKKAVNPPDFEWKEAILKANHSPIRELKFVFYLEDIPSYVSVHLVRHVHATPYVSSQRNDRQFNYDRRKAPQDTPVNMMWSMTAEELITISHKRLCYKASKETREVIEQLCNLVISKLPEFSELLIPNCIYRGGCTEYKEPCGFWDKFIEYEVENNCDYKDLLNPNIRTYLYHADFRKRVYSKSDMAEINKENINADNH